MFCLCRRQVLPGLTEYLSAGGRKIDAWYSKLKVAEVPFDDEEAAFSNVNTEAELGAFEHGPLPG
ncbi:molybdopterin-guanine dinucleotide biosynthesis protein MobA [compost metagenome]